MSELVHLDVAAGIATVTLDSPANRNALSRQLLRELRAHLEAALADDAVRVLVLTHTGPVFCSGMDLREARGADESDQGVVAFPDILELLWHSPKPTLARLAGTARAGGTGLAAACDVVLAADTVTFGFSEVRLGLVPAVISVLLARRVAPRPLQELLLSGEVFNAGHAAEIGLLSRAVAPDDLDAETARLAGLLALGAPGAVAATKALVNASLHDALSAASDVSARAFASPEGQEGMAAFAEKRKAAWVP
ncbi:MAG: Enoyl-CoA hydratase/isomerase [Frankiales bacterium]|nr:Enoyl-CoA hydratase/isomerase [Frankiales bacterium]